MGKPMLVALLLMVGPGLGPAGAAAQPSPAAVRQSGGDLFVAGGSVALDQAVAGDLLLSAGTADIDAAVAGDALACGGRLRLGADVGQSVYAAAGQLRIVGRVGRQLRAVGGQVALGPNAEVLGNAAVLAGRLQLQGRIRGHLQAVGGRLLIDGPIDGDVDLSGAHIALGPLARIGGTLRYRSPEALVQDPAATVAGGVERIAPPDAAGATGATGGTGATGRHGAAGHGGTQGDGRRGAAAMLGLLGGVWTLGLAMLAAALLLALPAGAASLAATLRERPGACLVLGFAGLVCLPAAALLLCISVIGIPLGLFTLALVAALLPLACAATGIGIGAWVLARWWPARAGAMPARIAASTGALVGLSLLGWIPGLGALLGFAALLAGLGALLLQVRQVSRAAAR